MKRVIASLLCVFILFSNTIHANNQLQSAYRIDGVAKFLLERANDNFMFILQENMKENPILECYLPQTYLYATSSGLPLLLQSGSGVWREVVEKDLKNFGLRLIYRTASANELKAWSSKLRDAYLNMLNTIELKVDQTYYPVNQLPLDANTTQPKLVEAVNSFTNDYEEAQSNIDAIIEKIRQMKDPKPGECPSIDYIAELDKVKIIINKLEQQLERAAQSDVRFTDQADNQEVGSTVMTQLAKLIIVSDTMQNCKKEIEAILDSHDDLTVQMFKLDQLIRQSIKSGNNPLISEKNPVDYERYSRYALSFAALSEAESSEQVQSIMQQLTIPPVNFGIKRHRGANMFLITAYFGLTGGMESTGTEHRSGYGGLSVPVGFEYSHGLSEGVLSVMIAPLDFAQPVNKILNDEENSAQWKDIFNPGVYLSYGFKKYP